MSYGEYENNRCNYKLSHKYITIQEKDHPERTHTISFTNKEYAENYFINDIGGIIPKIIKTWSYYIQYFKVQIGCLIKFYCVHEDENYKYRVYQIEYINENKQWKEVKKLEKDDSIYKLIIEEFEKQMDYEKQLQRLRWKDEANANRKTVAKEEEEEELPKIKYLRLCDNGEYEEYDPYGE